MSSKNAELSFDINQHSCHIHTTWKHPVRKQIEEQKSYFCEYCKTLGAIQVLHNAVECHLPEKSITKVYGSTLLVLRGM